MKRLIFTLFVMCLAIMVHAQATSLTIDCQNPGWLSSKIGYGDQQTIRSLTITGFINKDDIEFIGSMRVNYKLRHLDMSGVRIVDTDTTKNDVFHVDDLQQNSYDARWTYLALPSTIKSIYGYTYYLNADSIIYSPQKQYFFPRFCQAKQYSPSYIELGGNVTSIPNFTFDLNHDKLEINIVTNSLKIIGSRLLSRNDDSTFFKIKDLSTIEYLGYNALYNNNLGDTITLPTIKTFCENAFRYRKGVVVYLGKNLEEIGTDVSSYYKNGYSVPLNGAIIHIEAIQPPKLYHHSWELHEMKGDTIFVPSGCLNTYMANNEWKECVDKGYIVLLEEPKLLESIQLDKHEVALDAGETATLKATYEPEDADNVNIKWTSSDDAIVTVTNNGVIKAIKPGEAIIYATDEPTGIKDSCKVIVKTHVSSIAINPSSLTFDQLGQTKQLEVVFTPENAYDKTVTWQSSNTSVCFVSNTGFVTAMGDGSAVIIATTNDGGITASCIVKVDSKPLTNIELNEHSATINKGDTHQLSVTFTPADANDKSLTWFSTDGNVATVDNNGLVTAIADGDVKITVSAKEGALKDICDVKVVTPEPTGIESIKADIASGNAEVYNFKGERMSTLTRGVNIIRKDGDVIKKVIVR